MHKTRCFIPIFFVLLVFWTILPVQAASTQFDKSIPYEDNWNRVPLVCHGGDGSKLKGYLYTGSNPGAKITYIKLWWKCNNVAFFWQYLKWVRVYVTLRVGSSSTSPREFQVHGSHGWPWTLNGWLEESFSLSLYCSGMVYADVVTKAKYTSITGTYYETITSTIYLGKVGPWI